MDRDRLREITVGNGFNIGVDLAVEHMNDASGISGEGRVVSDHDDGVAFFVEGF